MKKVIKKAKIKYDAGGMLPSGIPYDMLLNTVGQLTAANAYSQEGAPNVGSMTASAALSGAGTGFALGNALMPGIGGAVGAVGGALIAGISGNKKAKKQQDEFEENKRREQAFKTRFEDSQRASFLQMYPSQGYEYNSMFANGGYLDGPRMKGGGDILKIFNGNLKNVAPGVAKANGKKHEQGGIDLLTTGNVPVEIEDDEVVKDGRYVFSDRLKVPGSKRTYAETALKVARTPEYIRHAQKQQKQIDVLKNPRNDQYRMGSAARKLETIVNPLDRLFRMQEQHKQTMKIKTKGPAKAAYGMDMAEPDPFRSELRFTMQRALDRYGPNAGKMATQFGNRAINAFLPFGNQGNPETNGRSLLVAGAAPALGAGFQMPPSSAIAGGAGPVTAGMASAQIAPQITGMANRFALNAGDALMPNLVKGPTNQARVDPIKDAIMQRMLAQQGQVPGLVDKYGARVLRGAKAFAAKGGPPGEEPPANGAQPRGVNIANALGKAAPYLDNVVNMMITNKTPQIPTPTYVDAPRLNTRFDINSQMSDIERTAAARNRALKDGSNNPQATRANQLMGYANDIYAKNALYGQRENVETDLKNKQALTTYDAQRANAGMFDNYQNMKMLRKDDIGRRQSMNAANLSEDMMYATQERNMKMRDDQELAMLALQYQNSGILERSDFADIMKQIESGVPLDQVLAAMEAKKKAKAGK